MLTFKNTLAALSLALVALSAPAWGQYYPGNKVAVHAHSSASSGGSISNIIFTGSATINNGARVLTPFAASTTTAKLTAFEIKAATNTAYSLAISSPAGTAYIFSISTAGVFSPIKITESNPTTPAANTLYTEGYAKAWITFDGAGPTIKKNFGISSITKNGTGDYTLNFTQAFNAANYAIICSCQGNSNTFCSAHVHYATAVQASLVRVGVGNHATAYDAPYISCAFFGVQ